MKKLTRRLGATLALVVIGAASPALGQDQSNVGLNEATARGVIDAIQATLDLSLRAFNKGDFKGYLHDFAAKLTYNELPVDRARLVEINEELKSSFPNLKMSYQSVRTVPLSATEATATTVAEFTGSTKNYDESGLPARYREVGQVTASYKREGNKWLTGMLQVSWNDSFIDIGREFGVMGFSTLPTLLGNDQPFRIRLYVGEDLTPGVGVSYAYATVPLSSVLEKAGAEEVFKALHFKPLSPKGIDAEMRSPRKVGTYAHVLVVNKVWKLGRNESLLGQKIYTRLVRVE